MRRAGFTAVHVEPASLLAPERARLGTAQWAGRAYERARRLPLMSAMLRASAPLLEAHGVAA